MRIPFDDGRGSRGIEGWYDPDSRVLYVSPTNCRWDWFTNVVGWLFPLKIDGVGIVNRTWWKEALWLDDYLGDASIIKAVGYSKGGAQVGYLFLMRNIINAVSIAGFPPFVTGAIPGVLYYKRGDVVPLRSRKRYREVFPVGRWSWPWKAHLWSRDEIQEVIDEGFF